MTLIYIALSIFNLHSVYEKQPIVDARGLDIFGNAPQIMKKSEDCLCPNCSRTLGAQKFAPHLEKCMGMGRNSSRLASKKYYCFCMFLKMCARSFGHVCPLNLYVCNRGVCRVCPLNLYVCNTCMGVVVSVP